MKRVAALRFLAAAVLLCLASILLVSCALEPAAIQSPTSRPVLSTSTESTRDTPILSPSAEISPTQTTLPIQTSTLIPAPSPTPTPTLRQLTSGGCCVQAFWSTDGSQVLYLDKPDPGAPGGIWGVRWQGGDPILVTERLGIYSSDMQLLAYPEGGQTIVERLADGQRRAIPSQGREISFSPDGAWVAWTAGQSDPPFDTARREIWVSRSDGTGAQLVQTLYRGGFSGWLPDGRLLISGKLSLEDEESGIYIASLDGDLEELARGERLRGILLSPGGTWLAYQLTFSSDPAQDGIWLANTQTGQQVRVPAFGSYRWRDDSRLLVIPLDLTPPVHQLWQFSTEDETYQPLTNPAVTPIRVANGDWSVSPDGERLVFLSAVDLNIWLLELPDL